MGTNLSQGVIHQNTNFGPFVLFLAIIVPIDPSTHRLVVILMPDQSYSGNGVVVTINQFNLLCLNVIIIHNNSLLIIN